MTSLLPHFDQPTPCAGLHHLFDSRNEVAHIEASKLCATCPVINQCATWAKVVRTAPADLGGALEGTWAGKHYVAARMPRRPSKEVA